MINSFDEYIDRVKNVEIPETLEYSLAVLWLHPSILPVGLVSVGECDLPIIKVPPKMKNGYGNVVQVIAVANTAFSGRENITDIILPPGMTMLPARTFANCKGLKNITFPKGIKRIKEGTFKGCCSLQNIYYEGSIEEWEKIEIINDKHEIEFGPHIPGRPVDSIKSERIVHVPGNEAIFSANIYFHCDLNKFFGASFDPEKIHSRDITYEKWYQDEDIFYKTTKRNKGA